VAFGQTETVIYTFQGQPGNDGYYPGSFPLLLDGSGNLYGMTTYGGGGPCTSAPYTGCGIIFQLVPSSSGKWTENAIWRFHGCMDGGYPAGLVASGGHFWGVTGIGGSGSCSGGCGYLFRLDRPATPGGTWTKTDVFNFPAVDYKCGITTADAHGNLYGAYSSTTDRPNGYVCELTLTSPNVFTTLNLYEFAGVARGSKVGDGANPFGVTFDSHGNLWGATVFGGYCQRIQGGSWYGTIFELTPPAPPSIEWKETVAYRFHRKDLNAVSGVAIDSQGAVYGVTDIETYKFLNGNFSVIANFSNYPPSGYAPSGGVVVDCAGNVYGTTAAGGQNGYGTVYQLTPPNYTYATLHDFAGGTDGWNPEGPMILGSGGAPYGTTQIGGNNGCQLGFGGTGCGIIFRLVP